jgi:hypothetical protein
MSKTMCKMDLVERNEKGDDPKYCCKKCGEKARKEKHLCHPKNIKENN